MPPSQPPPIPAPAAALLHRAGQLLQAGRPAEAVGPLHEAARWLPDHARVWHDLGLACLEAGRTGEAIAALQHAVATDPRYADAHLRLGIALEAAGALDAALAAYAQATALMPRLADAHYRAAALLDSLGESARAAGLYRRAASAAPKTTLGRIATARALLAEHRDAEAEKTLRQALALDKDNAVALDLLGNLLADAGRFEEARGVLLRAVERSPVLAGSYYDIARCRKIGPQDGALVERMRAAATAPGLDPAQRSRVHLALGKAADDLGDHAEAMRQFDAAEALRNRVCGFDLGAFAGLVDRLIAMFPPDLIAQAGSVGTASALPVFILGLPRSGTTLVEQILSAHPDVAAGGEIPFWNRQGQIWAQSATPPEAATLTAAAADYLRLLRGMAPQAARVTDKLPLNFLWAGLIHLALPQAVIVHCRRHPAATALSIHQTHFNPRMPFPTGGDALVGYIRLYERLMAHWRAVLPAARFVEVQYEALTAAPGPETRRLVAACGLDWSDACLRPEENARVIKTPSKWQARQPVHTGSAERWRTLTALLGPLRALAGE